MYYIGLDIGTSSLKAVVQDDNGTTLYQGSTAYSFSEPADGFRQIDPEIWYQAALRQLKKIFDQYSANTIAALGVTGQMHTTVFLDQNGAPLLDAILWSDIRSKTQAENLKKIARQLQLLPTVKTISTGCPAANTVWLQENEPALFARLKHIMTPVSYLVWRLTGNEVCDYCEASTSGFFDYSRNEWSESLLQALKLDRSILSEPVSSDSCAGWILPDVLESLGIHPSPQIPVTTGTGDNPASALALGILESRIPALSIGTSGVLIFPGAGSRLHPHGKNVRIQLSPGQMYTITQGTVRQAGGAHKWWIENILLTEQMDADQQAIDLNQLGKHNLLFIPHLTGDKLLYQNVNPMGSFIGLYPAARRADLTQAVFEGIGFALREVLDYLMDGQRPRALLVNGGAAHSKVWMTILANILNCELIVSAQSVSAADGAVILARKMTGAQIPNGNQEKKTMHYFPSDETAARYEYLYSRYRKVLRSLSELITDAVRKTD